MVHSYKISKRTVRKIVLTDNQIIFTMNNGKHFSITRTPKNESLLAEAIVTEGIGSKVSRG